VGPISKWEETFELGFGLCHLGLTPATIHQSTLKYAATANKAVKTGKKVTGVTVPSGAVKG
jgi:hypothetical protein